MSENTENTERGTVLWQMVKPPIPIWLHVNGKRRLVEEFCDNMNKFNSPSSNNSGTSSEASETHSVEDISSAPNTTAQSASSVSRLPKTWKRLKETSNVDKDAEAKRPPWRAVSVSTLPKPDKSALLRAKLLDASRRLRASKNSVALQTDMEPTKLMKEACIGAQTDLILYKDVGMLTDGSYTKKKESYDKFILTYSVSQLTDNISTTEVATQTLLPKVIGDDFLNAYNGIGDSEQVGQFSELERKLLDQIGKIRKTANMSEGLNNEAPTNYSVMNDNEEPEMLTTPNPLNRPNLFKSTLDSWNFEYDGLEPNSSGQDSFIPYILTPSRSWGAMAPLPLTMALRTGQFNTKQSMDWSLLLIAIDEIIQESNRLVDLIEDITARHNEKCQSAERKPVETLVSFQPPVQMYPADYWLSVVEQQEQQLNEMLNN